MEEGPSNSQVIASVQRQLASYRTGPFNRLATKDVFRILSLAGPTRARPYGD